jgi:hypothetical protein
VGSFEAAAYSLNLISFARMRIYWLNGSLTIQPENKRELGLLTELSENLKFEPPESDSSELILRSGDDLLHGVGIDHQVVPSAIGGQLGDQQPIVAVHETKKVLRYFKRATTIPD